MFDEIIDRRHMGSLKWDVADNELPMWVADMDFKTAPPIVEAMKNIASNGVYGYTVISDEWYEAYINWWKKRHDFTIEKQWLIFSTGVIPTLSSVVRKLTTPGENVVIMTPVYNIFFNSILNNGRNVLQCPLKYTNGQYSIDFSDLEQKLSDPQTSMLILCNPHNPIGKIWNKDTLSEIGNLCAKYHVLVVSDEIHCDITEPGCNYIPFASVSDECKYNSITCVAPTKAFNLAGLQTSAVIVPDENIRHKVWRCLNTDEVAEPNIFAATAPVVAFNQGEQWLDGLRQYIKDNKIFATGYIQENIPDVHAVDSEATYLLWIDCGNVCTDDVDLCEHIRKTTGLYVSDGSEYGSQKGFIRLNMACPKELLMDGMERLARGISTYKK